MTTFRFDHWCNKSHFNWSCKFLASDVQNWWAQVCTILRWNISEVFNLLSGFCWSNIQYCPSIILNMMSPLTMFLFNKTFSEFPVPPPFNKYQNEKPEINIDFGKDFCLALFAELSFLFPLLFKCNLIRLSSLFPIWLSSTAPLKAKQSAPTERNERK